jgi:hypothetical protein
MQLASTVARRIDNALTTVSISNADHEGWLAKQRELIDEYKQRYVTLADSFTSVNRQSNPSTHSRPLLLWVLQVVRPQGIEPALFR